MIFDHETPELLIQVSLLEVAIQYVQVWHLWIHIVDKFSEWLLSLGKFWEILI